MKSFILLLTMLVSISAYAEKATQYKFVQTSKTGEADRVLTIVRGKAIELGANEYSISTWNSFGITNDITVKDPYIIKDGSVWRDRTPAEVTAKDTETKTKVLDKTVEDAQLDAILRTIAIALAQNLKTYNEIKAVFTDSVDPKKAKKEKK